MGVSARPRRITVDHLAETPQLAAKLAAGGGAPQVGLPYPSGGGPPPQQHYQQQQGGYPPQLQAGSKPAGYVRLEPVLVGMNALELSIFTLAWPGTISTLSRSAARPQWLSGKT